MTLAGIAIKRVGLSPRHSVYTPSFLAIFRIPSSVELNVRRWVSSAAQSEMIASSMTAGEGAEAEAVPAFGTRADGTWETDFVALANVLGPRRVVLLESHQLQNLIRKTSCSNVPRRDVRTLPIVALIIFWVTDVSASIVRTGGA
jgi:hypothetical protein